MHRHVPVFTRRLFLLLGLGAVVAHPHAAGQGYSDGGTRLGLPWENDRIRLTELAADPGATIPASGNRVLVYFTADPDGRVPEEAVWQAAGAGDVRNRGPARLEALAIELKDVQGAAPGTPPEAFASGAGVQVTVLIDNPSVLVAKHRYDPIAGSGPLHFHAEDVLVVYLRAGYTWAWNDYGGALSVRVHRGDVDVIPANTLHRLGNAGGDPLELLVIVPR